MSVLDGTYHAGNRGFPIVAKGFQLLVTEPLDTGEVEDGIDQSQVLVGPEMFIDHVQDLPSREQFPVSLENLAFGIVDPSHEFSSHGGGEGCGEFSV